MLSYDAVILDPLPAQPQIVHLDGYFSDESARWLMPGCVMPGLHFDEDVAIVYDMTHRESDPRNVIASELFEHTFYGRVVVVPRNFTLLHWMWQQNLGTRILP
jgi:hypothetical protein